MKQFVIVLIVLCTIKISAQSEAKEKKIKTMLDLAGNKETSEAVMKNMFNYFRKTKTEVPEKVWNSLEKEFQVEDLYKKIIPIYDKYYTENDIDELIKFYNSPIGKKLSQTTPKITEESLEVGRAWGREIGERVMKRLQEEGY